MLKIIKKSIYRFGSFDEAKKYSIYTLIKYVIYVVGLVIILQIIGFNISILLAGSAALLVGLGLGIQNLFSDYVSGIIILLDSSIKVNDIIEVDGLVCKVLEINLRTTQVLTRDDKYILIPNTDITRKHVINWTHLQKESRFDVTVGVAYSSNVHTVMEIIKQATKNTPGIMTEPTPFVRFNNYADSALIFTVYFWSDDVFRVENIKSEIRIKIFDAFQANGIKIPFPQRVVHYAKDVM